MPPAEVAPRRRARRRRAPRSPSSSTAARTRDRAAPARPCSTARSRSRPDLPFACKGGVCGTCRASVTDGEVTMRRNYALEHDEVAAGYVLTCQALPTTDAVTVDYDA